MHNDQGWMLVPKAPVILIQPHFVHWGRWCQSVWISGSGRLLQTKIRRKQILRLYLSQKAWKMWIIRPISPVNDTRCILISGAHTHEYTYGLKTKLPCPFDHWHAGSNIAIFLRGKCCWRARITRIGRLLSCKIRRK